MELHIGSLIKEVAKEKRIGPTELGNKINTSKQNVYGIYKRKSCDAKLLFNISLALQHDFFMEYVRRLGLTSVELQGGANGAALGEAGFLKEKIDLLEENNDLQSNLVSMLKEKVAKLERENLELRKRLVHFEH